MFIGRPRAPHRRRPSAQRSALNFAPALLALALAMPARAAVPAGPADPADGDTPDKMLAGTAAWQFETNDAFASGGSGAATVGDVNGDGISDFAVGAENYTTNVGGTNYQGAVFIFHGTATGPATTPSTTLLSTYAEFGAIVAPAGDVNGDGYGDVLITAPVLVGNGRAFVHLGSASGVQATAAWQYAADGGFGSSAAPAGDVNNDGFDDIIIGAPTGSNWINPGPGLAYLFNGQAGGLGASPSWWQGLGGNYGTSVAGAGDVNADGYDDLIIGSPYVSGNFPVSYQGAAWIYHGGQNGPGAGWSTPIYGANQLGAGFGSAVAGVGDVDGDTYADVAVGAPDWDWPGATDAGRAFIYPGGQFGASSTAIWEEWGISAGCRFGANVQPAGDVNGDGLAEVAVNAPGNVVGSGVFSRYVVVVQGARAGVGVPLIEWSVTRNDATDWGSAFGTAGDVNNDGFSDLIVGSAAFSNGQTSEGRAEIFLGAGAGPHAMPAQQFTQEQESTYFGWQTTTVGDVNGDGFSDVVVSGPGIDYNQFDDGAFQLHYGSESGLQPGGTWFGDEAGGSFASAVAPAGDVNGDGYADILVGGPLTSGTGRAWCWHGGPSGPSPAGANWSEAYGSIDGWFGFSVAGVGDVNGDGYGDVLIGAPYDENDQSGEGQAYLFLGSASGLSRSPAWVVEGNQVDANLGISVSGAGDVNGDRLGDVVIGSDHWDVSLGLLSLTDSGRIQVYHGQRGGLAAAPAATITGSNSFMQYGSSVAAAGDIDGDGFGDIIVAARYADLGYTDEGQVLVYRGGLGGINPTVHWSVRGAQNFANFGAAIAGVGDTNGDGLDDVMIGSNFHDGNGLQDNGWALVYGGPLTGTNALLPLWNFRGQSGWENLGNAVGAGGDINGDGFADVLTGSPGWTDQFWGQGRMLVFYGNDLHDPANTLAWKVQQRRGDSSAPLGLLADAGLPATMRLRAMGGTGAGGGRPTRLEWEIKEHGEPLDGTGLVRGMWIGGAKSGGERSGGEKGILTMLDSGALPLVPGTSLHWRARAAGRSPYHPHSRWLSPVGNGANQADVITRNSALVAVDLPARGPGGPLPVVAAPNPFNPRTTLRFELPREAQVRVDVYDLRGALVRTLLDEPRPAGPAVVDWDGLDHAGRPVASGAYQARVRAGDDFGQVRVLLLK